MGTMRFKVIWVAVLLTCCFGFIMAYTRIQVDMTGSGCFSVEDRLVGDDEMYNLYADYRPNQKPSLDHCDVALRAKESNRRLEYQVTQLTIFDNGISVFIYDNPKNLFLPTRVLKYDDSRNIPIQGKSSHNILKFSLRKESTQANAFAYQILVKTDFGPPWDFEGDQNTFYEKPLDTGAIVGIVIAGSVLVIAVAGLSIYCCLKTRMTNRRHKHDEASDRLSVPTVYSTGSSGAFHHGGSNNQRGSQRGRQHGPSSQHSNGSLPAQDKARVYHNRFHSPQDGRVYQDSVDKSALYTDKDDNIYRSKENEINRNKEKELYKDNSRNKESNVYSNKRNDMHADKAYKGKGDAEKLDRQASLRHSQKRRQHDASFDDADRAKVKGGHVSRRDSSRSRVRYDKKTNYSRNDDYGTYGKSKKPGGGILRSRSRSPSASVASLGSTVDSNALVHGYNQTSNVHPNIKHVPQLDPRSRSRSRSRSRARADSQKSWGGSQRSGSVSRPRAGSVGRSASRDRDRQRRAPQQSRQYSDMTDFLPQDHRSRSESAGKRSRRH